MLGPLVDSTTWQEVPFRTIGPFQAIDTIFPGFPGDLELFTAKEVAKLKELGVLNPPNTPEHLPLFPPLVSSSRGKVVSTTLGAPPPDLDADGIGQSLVTDRDEESILSDSYLDHHSHTADSSTMWGKPTACTSRKENRNHRPQNARIGMATSLVIRTVTETVTRDRDRSRKSDNRHGPDQPRRCSP